MVAVLGERPRNHWAGNAEVGALIASDLLLAAGAAAIADAALG